MGLRLAHDEREQLVIMYDSVTDWAFGPVFTSKEAARRFWAYAEQHGVPGGDVRALTNEQLVRMWDDYCAQGGRRDDYE